MISEERFTGLLEAILADPSDDTPWLILADDLDDAGDSRTAGFIRHQLNLARHVAEQNYDSDEYAEAMKFFLEFGADDAWRMMMTFQIIPPTFGGILSLWFDADVMTVRISTGDVSHDEWTFRRGMVVNRISIPDSTRLS